MAKTTKRSKKFNIATSKSKKGNDVTRRGGGSAGGPSSRAPTATAATADTTAKGGGGGGGTKRTGKGGGGGRGGGDKKGGVRRANDDIKRNVVDEGEEEDAGVRKRRSDDDFVNDASLGKMDVDSFFEKAVGGLLGNDNGEDDDEDDIDGSDEEDDGGIDDDDEDDSYASLGSEEEDVEASEARLRRQLDELSSKDPEFYGYLRDNESSLLEYDDDDKDDGGDGVSDEDVGVDDDEGGDEGNGPTKAKQSNKKKAAEDEEREVSKFLLTPRRLEQLERGAFDPNSRSIRGLKRIVSAYGTACRLSDANRQDRDGDDDDDDEGGNEDDGGGGGGRGGKKGIRGGIGGGVGKKRREFQITSPVVFDRLMAVCLVRCHEEFRRHLLTGEGEADDDVEDDDSEEDSNGVDGNDDDDDDDEEGAKEKEEKKQKKERVALDENRPLHPKTLAKSPNWTVLRPVIESFLRSSLHILSEAGKEADLLRFVLSALAHYVPYLSAYPRLARPTLRTCVRLWCAPLDTSEGHNAVRLQAFLRIRQLAITQPYPLIEDCLKSTYLGYARRSKFGTASNVSSVLPTLTFMGNCVVEVYALDYASAYQHAFVYIRQLALHLRSAMTKKTPESRAVVCCWQYVHCLKLWVAVLCAACGGNGGVGGVGGGTSKLGGGPSGKDEEANLLRSLVYPLTEVIFGVCRLVPVAQYVPLRLHCVRLLQQLAASTGTFVPTTSLLLGVLDHGEVGMKPLRGDGGGKKGKKNKKKSAGTIRGLRLPVILKLPKEGTLRTMEQLDGVLKETFVLLNRELDLYRYSPGFPEFTFSIMQRLRKVS
jgi:hypothetical protein